MKRNLYHENWVIHHLWFIYSILPGLPDDFKDQMPGYEFCITLMPIKEPGGSADLVPPVEETYPQSGEEGAYYS